MRAKERSIQVKHSYCSLSLGEIASFAMSSGEDLPLQGMRPASFQCTAIEALKEGTVLARRQLS
jgi:hypothetical protein